MDISREYILEANHHYVFPNVKEVFNLVVVTYNDYTNEDWPLSLTAYLQLLCRSRRLHWEFCATWPLNQALVLLAYLCTIGRS